jgi:prepilin-type N-terminal cleavage/methylation domain-containing protein
MKDVKQAGFTIIELMIATVIFTGIMIVLTFGVIQITHTYYKGITENKTQNVARNVITTINQALQFNGAFNTGNGTINSLPYNWLCIGSSAQFTYALGYELTDGTLDSDQTHYALIQSSGCPGAGVNLSAGTELLDPSMRVSSLSVTALSSTLDQINLQVTYGDDALLTSPPTLPTVSCLGGADEQFCTVSALSTVVNPGLD